LAHAILQKRKRDVKGEMAICVRRTGQPKKGTKGRMSNGHLLANDEMRKEVSFWTKQTDATKNSGKKRKVAIDIDPGEKKGEAY